MANERSQYVTGRCYVPDLWEQERVRKIITDTRQHLQNLKEVQREKNPYWQSIIRNDTK